MVYVDCDCDCDRDYGSCMYTFFVYMYKCDDVGVV
jgi:hypothetical protein